MSRTLLLALLAAAVAPASASANESGDLRRVADEMADPQTQQRMARAMGAMAEAMLDMPVGPLLRAADAAGGMREARRLPRDARLGDLAGPDSRRLPRDMARAVPEMMGAMGGMAGAMEAMLPELARVGERMREAMERGRGEGDHWRDDDPRPDYRGDPDEDDERDEDFEAAPDAQP